MHSRGMRLRRASVQCSGVGTRTHASVSLHVRGRLMRCVRDAAGSVAGERNQCASDAAMPISSHTGGPHLQTTLHSRQADTSLHRQSIQFFCKVLLVVIPSGPSSCYFQLSPFTHTASKCQSPTAEQRVRLANLIARLLLLHYALIANPPTPDTLELDSSVS